MNEPGDSWRDAQTCTFRLRQGERITVHAIRPQDADSLQAYVRGLSSETRRNRFLGAVSELTPARVEHLIHMDRPHQVALLGFARTGAESQIVAEAMLVKAPNSRRCEIALSVADAWQRKGVGTLLLRTLECRARMLGARFLFGDVLRTNTAMKWLARRAGFSIRTTFTDARLVEVDKDLSMLQSSLLYVVGNLRSQTQ